MYPEIFFFVILQRRYHRILICWQVKAAQQSYGFSTINKWRSYEDSFGQSVQQIGNWHLESVREMIPFFHAAGHLAYAKSAHLYLQQMSVLEKRMPASEYEYFTKKGGFTIRRTHKMWAGIWSNMTIEQVLLRQLKVSGGLTHGQA